MITLLLLVRATYLQGLFFVHNMFEVNCTFQAAPTERLQQQYFVFLFLQLTPNAKPGSNTEITT